MSTTVYESLLNAQTNFQTLGSMGGNGNPFYTIAMEQLNNAMDAIRNGNTLDWVIQEHALGDVDIGE